RIFNQYIPRTQNIVARHYLENIPIIAVTGNAAPTDGDEILAIGFADYLFKPFSLEIFLEAINNHFKKSDL
ncbi:MAG TPA: hypothetical protein PLS57_02225, partial [Smithellaceae bacterium]|nr:hypothetical protein [Smithellaceae bacterium]HPM69718.1 hypothetical protein [Smithellaceae bacterium]HPW22501.1 hypothetical protein [Smithellaceae bacterium]